MLVWDSELLPHTTYLPTYNTYDNISSNTDQHGPKAHQDTKSQRHDRLPNTNSQRVRSKYTNFQTLIKNKFSVTIKILARMNLDF